MANATLNVTVIEKRLLTATEAAQRCGRPQKRFKIECPCQPVKFANGDLRYDVRDLDAWIDTLKAGGDTADDQIVSRI